MLRFDDDDDVGYRDVAFACLDGGLHSARGPRGAIVSAANCCSDSRFPEFFGSRKLVRHESFEQQQLCILAVFTEHVSEHLRVPGT